MYRLKVLVKGVVQGVGFRPFCARMALVLGVAGSVRNTGAGVELVLEGGQELLAEYLRALVDDAPTSAVVTEVTIVARERVDVSARGFRILPSEGAAEAAVLIPPDLAVCPDCLTEMNDPADRRFRYPFINCTNCGPRYTIIRGLPYDRPQTTMDGFAMCGDCAREYDNPLDRRYHAQPNACPACGPHIWLQSLADGSALVAEKEQALQLSCQALAADKIVAIKGIGGFHLACLPHDGPIAELRRRKHRLRKPFALMARDLAAARLAAVVTSEAERLLCGPERPIVLCPLREDAPVSRLTAPAQERLGLMLPYTPLHHLLMESFSLLVMTSANISGAPIIADNEDALRELRGIADLVLLHDREIHTPIDDSVLLPAEAGKIFLRRARGFVPRPLPAMWNGPDLLAAGAQMKSAYAISHGGSVFPGEYLGDLGQLGTARRYRRSLANFLALYHFRPQALACDLHPGYIAAGLARDLCPDVKTIAVQHHHAHMASLLCEAGHRELALGAIFDGTGYGPDGTVWGGEFLLGDLRSFERLGSLRPFCLPGGELAIREPWRVAMALLFCAEGEAAALGWAQSFCGRRPGAGIFMPEALRSALIAAPLTTSCGRLFDGLAALLGTCSVASFDGEAAASLEAMALRALRRGLKPASLSIELRRQEEMWLLDWRAVVVRAAELGTEALTVERESFALAFHRALAHAVSELCAVLGAVHDVRDVALSGGVWQNALLLDLTCVELRKRGMVPLVHEKLSPNDEGVAVGQLAVAAFNL